MIRSSINTWALLAAVTLTTWQVQAQTAHKFLLEGDRQYDREQYQQSESAYRTAADANYGDPKALYNLANALYQQGKWEDAAQRYEQAARGLDLPAEKADALHNLGNAQMQLRKFKEAVTAFENSLRLRPGDPGTKANLQMAKKKLKEEEAQKQSQQQNQAPQQPENQDQPPPPQGEQNQPNQPQQKQEQPQNQPQQPNQEQQQPGKMSKEEAKRLLETAVGPEDQSNARKYRSAQQRQGKRSKKDW